MSKIKACWFCPHFHYSNSDPGYSEMTPGSDFGMSCVKGKWDFDSDVDGQEEFGRKLMTANTCEHYSVKVNR